ncbi:energy transducer TonB [Phenylobacterium sp. VNQ135]|uniref:energy transducer TonB n=1 Tax=Phenylobacterium sp. VNQ135 TaxID=3400922 RepID=UPI003C0DEA2D
MEVSPAAIGSLALHAGVAAALMISWGARDLKVGAVTPVTIVSSAPDFDTRPAIEGPTEQTALAETPVPDAPATPEVPVPQPQPAPPTPPQPTPRTTPTPKAAPPTPAPKAAPTPKPPPKPSSKAADASQDFFASLEQTLSKSRPAGGRPSPAPKGQNRAETSTTPRNTAGSGLAAGADMQGLVQELQRRWNPNCEVEGGRDVVVRVVFNIGSGGQLVGQVASEIRGPRTPVAQASAERAERAVYAASPFRGLSRDYYGQRIAVNFNAREACASR